MSEPRDVEIAMDAAEAPAATPASTDTSGGWAIDTAQDGTLAQAPAWITETMAQAVADAASPPGADAPALDPSSRDGLDAQPGASAAFADWSARASAPDFGLTPELGLDGGLAGRPDVGATLDGLRDGITGDSMVHSAGIAGLDRSMDAVSLFDPAASRTADVLQAAHAGADAASGPSAPASSGPGIDPTIADGTDGGTAGGTDGGSFWDHPFDNTAKAINDWFSGGGTTDTKPDGGTVRPPGDTPVPRNPKLDPNAPIYMGTGDDAPPVDDGLLGVPPAPIDRVETAPIDFGPSVPGGDGSDGGGSSDGGPTTPTTDTQEPRTIDGDPMVDFENLKASGPIDRPLRAGPESGRGDPGGNGLDDGGSVTVGASAQAAPAPATAQVGPVGTGMTGVPPTGSTGEGAGGVGGPGGPPIGSTASAMTAEDAVGSDVATDADAVPASDSGSAGETFEVAQDGDVVQAPAWLADAVTQAASGAASPAPLGTPDLDPSAAGLEPRLGASAAFEAWSAAAVNPALDVAGGAGGIGGLPGRGASLDGLVGGSIGRPDVGISRGLGSLGGGTSLDAVLSGAAQGALDSGPSVGASGGGMSDHASGLDLGNFTGMMDKIKPMVAAAVGQAVAGTDPAALDAALLGADFPDNTGPSVNVPGIDLSGPKTDNYGTPAPAPSGGDPATPAPDSPPSDDPPADDPPADDPPADDPDADDPDDDPDADDPDDDAMTTGEGGSTPRTQAALDFLGVADPAIIRAGRAGPDYAPGDPGDGGAGPGVSGGDGTGEPTVDVSKPEPMTTGEGGSTPRTQAALDFLGVADPAIIRAGTAGPDFGPGVPGDGASAEPAPVTARVGPIGVVGAVGASEATAQGAGGPGGPSIGTSASAMTAEDGASAGPADGAGRIDFTAAPLDVAAAVDPAIGGRNDPNLGPDADDDFSASIMGGLDAPVEVSATHDAPGLPADLSAVAPAIAEQDVAPMETAPAETDIPDLPAGDMVIDADPATFDSFEVDLPAFDQVDPEPAWEDGGPDEVEMDPGEGETAS